MPRKKYSIGSIAEVQTGPFGSQLHQSDYIEDGTPIITVEHLGDNRILHTDLPTVTDDDKERLGRYSLKEGDIVFSRVGSVDRRAYVGKEESGWLFSGRCLRVRVNSSEIDSKWLSYYFGLPSFKEYIRGIAVGATMPSLNTALLSDVEVEAPSLCDQQQIAYILSSLDEMIELNHQTNKTLEEIGQALFKRWFVDFEFPDKNGKPYKSSGGKMVDSELGEIPKEWGVMTIGDVVRVVGGSTPSTKNPEFWDGDIHWATPKDLSSLSSEVLLNTERCITEAGLQEIGSGLLPVGTVLLSSRAPIGYIAVAEIPVAINQGFIGITCNDEAPTLFIKEWVKQNLDVIKGRANGTTFQEISKSNFRPIPIIVPQQEIVEKYALVAESIYRQVVTFLKQTNALIEIRDSLLPKLMSGKIRVG